MSFLTRINFGKYHPCALVWRIAGAISLSAGVALAQTAPAAPANDTRAWEAFNRSTAPHANARYTAEGKELTIYNPTTTDTAQPGLTPVLLLIHGGGWSGGKPDALAPHARYFAARGWACVNVSYRLTSEPGVTIQKAIEDIRAAFDWVRAQAKDRGWDATRIAVLGESAGGQLACALGILPPEPTRWRAHSLVLVNPVLDLTTLTWALTVPGVNDRAIDPRAPEKHPAWAVSPLFHLRADAPPILVVHGRDDSSVPFSQAEAFVQRSRAIGAKVDLVALEKTGHAFLLPEFGQPPTIRSTLQRIAEFLGRPASESKR